MNVREGSFVLTNVLSLKQIVANDDWSETAVLLRNHVVTEGIYPVGPIVFERTPIEEEPELSEYTFYVALNETLEMNEGSEYEFNDFMVVPEAIYTRYSDFDGDITVAYKLLKDYAQKHNLQLDQSFFHVCLDVFGEVWFDIYAPIINMSEDEKND